MEEKQQEMSNRQFNIIVFILLSLLVLTIWLTTSFTVVDGQIVTKPTQTPWPTPTPDIFEVTIKVVQDPQVLTDPKSTFLVVEIVSAERGFQPKTLYNMTIPYQNRKDVFKYAIITLDCHEYLTFNEELFCDDDTIKVINTPEPNIP